MTLHPKFITDEAGNKNAVVLSIKEYNKLIEELEDIEDIRLYDEAKKSDHEPGISIEEYVKQRKAKNV